MRIIISVVGQDCPGILAKVSTECATHQVNILDVSQTVLQDLFTMIMVCETTMSSDEYLAFVNHMEKEGARNKLSVHVMNEDLFNAMHKI